MLSSPAPLSKVAPSRFVTVELASHLTGLTQPAIRTKISRGVWLQGREYVRAPDGHVMIDIKGFEQWVASPLG